MATKKTGKRKTAELTYGSKSDFVRSHPGLPAQELSALAKKQGFKLSAGLIYNVRATDKRRAGKSASAVQSGNGHAPVVATDNGRAANSSEASLESQLRSVVLRVGLDRAEAVLTELRAQVKNLA